MKGLMPIFLTTSIKLKTKEKQKVRKSLFEYDEKKDCYYCPAAFEIPFTRVQKRKCEPDLRYSVCNYCFQCVLKMHVLRVEKERYQEIFENI